MAKLKLYKVNRFYSVPAEVLVIAESKSHAKELSNRKYGANDGQIVKKVKFEKPRVLHLN